MARARPAGPVRIDVLQHAEWSLLVSIAIQSLGPTRKLDVCALIRTYCSESSGSTSLAILSVRESEHRSNAQSAR
jgi:hypothetical protein